MAISMPPVIEFTISVSSGVSPLSVVFTNTTSDADSYLWDFGDGETSTEVSPTHIYSEEGTYNGSLSAVNMIGTSTEDFTITVTPLDSYERLEPTIVSFTSTSPEDVEYEEENPSTDRVFTREKPTTVTWS